jgi:transcriptional regulator with XRE-family HTH domain|tara:strand:- start:2103 stop:2327 length:225 start_codon:yes stop_codon:yes gene_type:complete
MTITSPLIANLDAIRLREGKTLHHMAYDLGVAKDTYVKWRSGLRHPPVRTIHRLISTYPELSQHVLDEIAHQAE